MAENERRFGTGEFFITLAVTAALPFAAAFFPLFIVVLPLPAVYVWIRSGAVLGLCFTALTILIPLFCFGGVWTLILIPVALVCCVGGIVLKRRVRSFLGLAAVCGAALLGCVAVVGAVAISSGTDFLSAFIAKMMELSKESEFWARLIYIQIGAQELFQGNMSVSVFWAQLSWDYQQLLAYITTPESADALRALLTVSMPQIGMGYAVYTGLLSYILPRIAAKARGSHVAPIPAFSRFVLPRSISPYFVITFVLGEIVLLAGWQMFYFAAYAVLMGVGLVLAIQGLSLIYWFLQPKIPSKGVCVLIIVLIAVFLGSILKWVGLFEQLVRIRDRKI